MKKELVYAICGLLIGLLVGALGALFFCQKSESVVHKMSSMQHASGDDFDKAFLADMIDHHQSGVDMAKLADANAKHDELKMLAADIITLQSEEIDTMQTWQREWGYNPVHPAP